MDRTSLCCLCTVAFAMQRGFKATCSSAKDVYAVKSGRIPRGSGSCTGEREAGRSERKRGSVSLFKHWSISSDISIYRAEGVRRRDGADAGRFSSFETGLPREV
jgi:hypothetical protein